MSSSYSSCFSSVLEYSEVVLFVVLMICIGCIVVFGKGLIFAEK